MFVPLKESLKPSLGDERAEVMHDYRKPMNKGHIGDLALGRCDAANIVYIFLRGQFNRADQP